MTGPCAGVTINSMKADSLLSYFELGRSGLRLIRDLVPRKERSNPPPSLPDNSEDYQRLREDLKAMAASESQKEGGSTGSPSVIIQQPEKVSGIPSSSRETQEATLPRGTLTTEQCIACLAHNHYLAARGRIKEAIRFYNREGDFSDTVIEKLHDVMEDLITPERDDYAARAGNPVLNKMLRDMQKRGDDIKKELEEVVLDYENRTVSALESIRDKIVDIQKAAWQLTAIEKKLTAGAQ